MTTLPPDTAIRRPADHGHQPELDGIRGIAILAVLASHAAGMMGVLPHLQPHPAWTPAIAFLLVPGWGGVDLFFVLSGFLITGILLRARTRPTYFTSFYARRVLRIFPVYYLFLTVTVLAAHIWPAFADYLPSTYKQRLSYFLYLQNWPWFWQGWAGLTSSWGVFWSLAVEEQFYLVWPTIIRFVSLPALLALCLAGVILGSPLRWWLAYHVTGLNVAVLQFPISRLDGLFLGAACALYREIRGRAVPLRWSAISFGLGSTILIWIAAFHTRELVGIGPHITIVGVTGFVLMAGGLVVASQHPMPRLRQLLTLRPLTLAGKYSYGMYVYHLMVYLAFEALAKRLSPQTHGEFTALTAVLYIAVTIVATTLVAVASFHWFESPFLRLKRFFPSPSAPIAR